MSTLVTRSGKGSPLTHNEVDANFTNLNTDKVEKTSADITGGTINNTTIGATTPSTGVFTTVTTPIVGAATGSSTTGLDLNVNSKAQARIVEIGDGTRPLVINGGSAGGAQIPGITATTVLAISGGGGNPIRFYTNGRVTTQQAEVSHTASAVNYHQLTGSATGSGPIHSVAGSDTNIDNNLTSKGTGNVNLNSGNGTQFRVESSGSTATDFVMVGGSSTGRPFIRSAATSGNIDLAVSSQGTGSLKLYTNFVGQEQARVTHTASAVNYVQVTGAATGGRAIISMQGSDTNIPAGFYTKGSGGIDFRSYGGSNNQFVINGSAVAVNYLQVAGSATGIALALSAQGSDTNIDLTLTPKGTGNVRFGTYTGTILTPTGYVEIKDSGGTVRRLLVG
jgi:hypothetical protein